MTEAIYIGCFLVLLAVVLELEFILSDINEPAIYVGTYAKYNNGSIYGKWLYPARYNSRSEFYAACFELHADENDPELMFQDWEHLPKASVNQSGYLEWDYIEGYQKAKEDHKEEAYAAFVDWSYNTDYSEFEDLYYGEAENEEKFTEEYLHDTGMLSDLPDWVLPAIDYEFLARDLFSSDFAMHDGYVFRNG